MKRVSFWYVEAIQLITKKTSRELTCKSKVKDHLEIFTNVLAPSTLPNIKNAMKYFFQVRNSLDL